MNCKHDESEKDTEIADGACPICLSIQKEDLMNLLQWIYDDGEGGQYRGKINQILIRYK